MARARGGRIPSGARQSATRRRRHGPDRFARTAPESSSAHRRLGLVVADCPRPVRSAPAGSWTNFTRLARPRRDLARGPARGDVLRLADRDCRAAGAAGTHHRRAPRSALRTRRPGPGPEPTCRDARGSRESEPEGAGMSLSVGPQTGTIETPLPCFEGAMREGTPLLRAPFDGLSNWPHAGARNTDWASPSAGRWRQACHLCLTRLSEFFEALAWTGWGWHHVARNYVRVVVHLLDMLRAAARSFHASAGPPPLDARTDLSSSVPPTSEGRSVLATSPS